MGQFFGVPGPSQEDFNTLNSNLQKFFYGPLTYNGTTGFPVTKKPPDGKAICITAYNQNTGAIYALWYRSSSQEFRVGATINGNAPSNGDIVNVFYPTNE